MIAPSFCFNCGEKLGPAKSTMKFCPSCGTKQDDLVDREESDDITCTSSFGRAPPSRPRTTVNNASPSSQTLETFVLETWLDLRSQEVSENTYRVEEGFWTSENGILASLGDIELHQLRPLHFEQHVQSLRSRGCTARTMQLHRSAYIAALKYLVYVGVMKESGEIRPIKTKRGEKWEVKPFSAGEVKRLLEHASSPMHRALFALGIGQGLRPSELLRVEWQDFDFERKTIKIRGTKTAASDAIIPLTGISEREMSSWRDALCERNGRGSVDKGLCFYHQQTGRPITSFKRSLMTSCYNAGLSVDEMGEERRVFPYLLRHSFATLAATSSPPVPLSVVQTVMRHTSSKMLLDVYAKAGQMVVKEGLQHFHL